MHARLACLCNERERNEHGTNTALPKALDRQLFCAKFFLVPFFWIDICNNSPHFSWPGRHSFKFGYLKEKLNRESSHIFTSFCLISSPSNLAKHRHHSTKTFFWHLWVLLLLSTQTTDYSTHLRQFLVLSLHSSFVPWVKKCSFPLCLRKFSSVSSDFIIINVQHNIWWNSF